MIIVLPSLLHANVLVHARPFDPSSVLLRAGLRVRACVREALTVYFESWEADHFAIGYETAMLRSCMRLTCPLLSPRAHPFPDTCLVHPCPRTVHRAVGNVPTGHNESWGDGGPSLSVILHPDRKVLDGELGSVTRGMYETCNTGTSPLAQSLRLLFVLLTLSST